MRILSRTDAVQVLEAARLSIQTKEREITELTSQAADLDKQAQAAEGAARDRLDGEYQTMLRRIERSRGDLPKLNAALQDAERGQEAAHYLESQRALRGIPSRLAVAQTRISDLENQIARLMGELDAARADGAAIEREARDLSNVSFEMQRRHAGDQAYLAELAQSAAGQLDG